MTAAVQRLVADPHRQEAFDNPAVALQMGAQPRRGEAAGAGQGHGQQQLVGEVLVRRAAAFHPADGLRRDLFRHPFGADAGLAEGAEDRADVLAVDPQQQGVARPLVLREELQLAFFVAPTEALADPLQLTLADVPGNPGEQRPRLAPQRRAWRRSAAPGCSSCSGRQRAGRTRASSSPPPAGTKPWRSSSRSTSAPIRCNSGSQLSRRKSAGGASGLWVPPLILTRLSPFAASSAGSRVCSTSEQLPAEPMAKA